MDVRWRKTHDDLNKHEGDVQTVQDSIGREWVARGWVDDLTSPPPHTRANRETAPAEAKAVEAPQVDKMISNAPKSKTGK